MRFVVGPDRVVVPDLGARLPGRGIWLSARADVLETARARGAFARAAKGAVTCSRSISSPGWSRHCGGASAITSASPVAPGRRSAASTRRGSGWRGVGLA